MRTVVVHSSRVYVSTLQANIDSNDPFTPKMKYIYQYSLLQIGIENTLQSCSTNIALFVIDKMLYFRKRMNVTFPNSASVDKFEYVYYTKFFLIIDLNII